jgi:PhnB protein
MSSHLSPYLSFRDNAREAMDFYQSALGGEVAYTTFGEFNASAEPAEKEKIMHAELTTPSGYSLMAADTPAGMELPTGSSVSMSLFGDDEVELTGYWEKLAVGGTVTMPLEMAPWGDTFGMLTDKFGTEWMVNISGTPAS